MFESYAYLSFLKLTMHDASVDPLIVRRINAVMKVRHSTVVWADFRCLYMDISRGLQFTLHTSVATETVMVLGYGQVWKCMHACTHSYSDR